MLEEHLAVADGGERGGAAAEGALAGLLGRGVHRLPAAHSRGQVVTGHPALVPHVEVPARNARLQSMPIIILYYIIYYIYK